MRKLLLYLSFIRFSHSVFALPFALTGALLAWQHAPFSWLQMLWVIVAMVAARSAARGAQPPGRGDVHRRRRCRFYLRRLRTQSHLRMAVTDRTRSRVLVFAGE